MDDTFGHLVQRFGYFAVAVGTFLEGETILILASLVVVQGHLQLEWVILSAALGAFAGDIASYYLGVWNADLIFKLSPIVKRFYPRAQNFLKRYGAVSVFIARFLYGLRLPTGVFCGLTRMKIVKFATVAMSACLVWSALWIGLGYTFGQSLSLFVDDVQKYEKYVLGAALILLVGFSFVRRIRANSKAAPQPVAVIDDVPKKAELPVE